MLINHCLQLLTVECVAVWVLQYSWAVSLIVKNARTVVNLDSQKAEFVAENAYDVAAHVVNLDSDHGQLYFCSVIIILSLYNIYITTTTTTTTTTT